MAISKGKIIGLVVLLVAILGAGYYVGAIFWKKNNNDYSVVYLQSGEIYVGKLSRFPRLVMKDAYLLKNTRDAKNPEKTNLQLIPLAESAWAPVELYLDLSQVLFYGPLSDNSGAAQALVKAGKSGKTE